MHRHVERAYSGAKAVVHEIRREDVTFMAASIAYHAFVSMFPILVLLMLIVSAFGSQRFETTVVELMSTLLPATGQEVLTNTLRNATTSVGLSIVGIGVLLWGTSKIFRAMDAAFAELYDTERKLSMVDQLRDALVVVLALGVAAIGMVILGSLVEVPGSVPFARLFNSLLAVLGLAVAFFPIYYVFPNIDVSIGEVLPGVLVAAIGWIGLKYLFNVYVSISAKPDVYGLIGTIVLLVTWLYVGGLLLLVGAAVNSTIAGRSGDRATRKRGKRRFGNQVTDIDGFEHQLDEVIGQAADADISEEEIRHVLREHAEAAKTSSDPRSPVTAETRESDQG